MSKNNDDDNVVAYRSNAIFTIFALIVVALMLFNIFRSGSEVTFTGFLNFLSNCPTLIPTLSLNDFTILVDWGVFNFLRDFFNIFGRIIGVATISASSVFNCITYLLYFIVFLLS